MRPRHGIRSRSLALIVALAGAAACQQRSAEVAPAAARPAEPATPASAESGRYVPDYELKTGGETTLVLVGASFCGANRRPGFKEAVEAAKLSVRDQARAKGRQFRAVAVSLDWSTKEALAFLEGFGEFDEISVGSNWVNDGALRYIWRDFPAEPEVPQLLVLEREIEAEPAVRVRSERVVKRVSGSDAILAWVGAGARL